LAVNLMMTNFVGALVVVPCEGAVLERSFSHTGVEIDAVISYDLLITLFRPSAPMHDGTAVIRGGRIWRTGCYAPLSESPQAAHLGSRHRAGLGYAERGDVLSIIVSESGTLSIAFQGKLKCDITLHEFRRILGCHTTTDPDPFIEDAPQE